jgi:ATP-binding cassette subfamily C (CFTR/MRP) protein 4
MKMIVLTFKYELAWILGIFTLDILCRLTFSLFIYKLFLTMIEPRDSNSEAYLCAGILILLMYTSLILRQTGLNRSYLFLVNVKSCLSMLLFSKIVNMTFFSLKSQTDIGKLANLLVNDMVSIEIRITLFLNTFTFPLVLLGTTTLLIIRVGWVAVVGVIIVILFIPISNLISSHNGDVIGKENTLKDRRVDLTTDLIEGIKYIKLYGWELAFKKIIGNIREEQINNLFRLAFWRSIEKGFGNAITLISSLAIFILVACNNDKLTLAKLFSTLEMISFLRFYVSGATAAIGTYHEIKVILGRYVNIFNLKNKAMIKIDHKGESSRDNNLKDGEVRDNLIEGEVRIINFCGFWNEDFERPSLKDINIRFAPGKLYGITGKVGSGKSGLLSAIMGEIPYYSG